MEPVPYILYHDDRLFVMDINLAHVERSGGIATSTLSKDRHRPAQEWTLTTRRNHPGFPPIRADGFDSIAELVAYVRGVEPSTPRISLDGAGPDPVPSYEDYSAWLSTKGLLGALEKKVRDGGYFVVPEWREKLAWESRQVAEYLDQVHTE